jgi:uncharacterized protein YdeI (YjbR/CyaY-like superfamily)
VSRDDPGSPTFFETPEAFRRWLAEHHESEEVLWVGYYKKATGRPSITWPESVDEALCFGWIDGLRKKVDEEAYTVRFTPRKPASHWSRVNIEKVEKLLAEDRMEPAGLAAWEARDPERSGRASYEREKPAKLPPEMEKRFRAREDAWAWFRDQAPWYRRTALHWVTSAKRQSTRERRLDTLIEDSAAGRRVKPLRRAETS